METNDAKRIYIETNIFKPLGGRRKGPCTY